MQGGTARGKKAQDAKFMAHVRLVASRADKVVWSEAELTGMAREIGLQVCGGGWGRSAGRGK